MHGRRILLVGLGLALLIGGKPAVAAPAAADAVTRAEKLYLEGAALYRVRRYEDAVRTFERAYRVYPEPNLLYNMGRCYEAMGRLKDAIERYQRFVADNRSAAKAKKKARAKIALLSQILAKTAKKAPPAQPKASAPAASAAAPSSAAATPQPQVVVVPTSRQAPPPVWPPKATNRFGVSKWLTAIAGLALAGGGVAFFMLGHADHQEVQDAIDAADGGVVAMPQAEAAKLIDEGDTKKVVGYALMGAGAAALITSVLLFALGGPDEAPAAPPVEVGMVPGGAIIGVGGRF